jgi:hypothetical protein
MFDNLSDAQVAYLANLAGKEAKKRRATLAPGTYSLPARSIDIPMGVVNVGEDGDKTPTVAIPLLGTLTVALHRAGFQREGILKLVIEAANEAIANKDRVGTELDTTVMYLEKEMKILKARLASDLTRTPVKGKVTVKVGR